MCQGDMSLYTYRWLPEQDEPDIIAGMEHMCVDFDKVMEWSKERSFSINDGLLQSPYRGNPSHDRRVNGRLTRCILDTPWDPSTLSHDH